MHQVNSEYATHHRGWTEGLFDVAALLIPLLEQHSPDMDREREWFSAILDRMRLTVPGALQRRARTAENNELNDDYFQARYEMMMSARRHRCMNLECSIASNMAATSTLCAQCGVVSYCSTQCQKSAWHADRSPHKDVCVLIGGVRKQLGLDRPARLPAATDKVHKQRAAQTDEEWWKWLMRSSAAAVRSTLREKGVTPRTCRAIWLHLQLLGRAKGVIPPRAKFWSASVLRAQSLGSMKEMFHTAYIEDFQVPVGSV
ncbi:hypothetical protein C8R43DRAFT_1125367 [Mycena crocata]|nr:hypothetical protein C8R43DRAFT_1125367 [Mycena crocata]